MKASQEFGLAAVPLGVTAPSARLRVHIARRLSIATELEADVRLGLTAERKSLPPKYFYDHAGSQLFETICDLPEYYLTRSEHQLLTDVAGEIVDVTQPAEIVELGSGSARKTRLLFSTIAERGRSIRYVPFDVSETMLRNTATELLAEYPRMSIAGIVGDYERDLHHLPRTRNRLVLFLGSTVGNLDPTATAQFLGSLRQQLRPGDFLLLGVDLLKPIAILEAAYNDARGVTAQFNRNVLRVINRQLDANFAVEAFDHVAFFNREASQIEMHLRSRRACSVRIRRLGITVVLSAGETIHTEISRKFTRVEVEQALHDSGFELSRWYESRHREFGLALAQVY